MGFGSVRIELECFRKRRHRRVKVPSPEGSFTQGVVGERAVGRKHKRRLRYLRRFGQMPRLRKTHGEPDRRLGALGIHLPRLPAILDGFRVVGGPCVGDRQHFVRFRDLFLLVEAVQHLFVRTCSVRHFAQLPVNSRELEAHIRHLGKRIQNREVVATRLLQVTFFVLLLRLFHVPGNFLLGNLVLGSKGRQGNAHNEHQRDGQLQSRKSPHDIPPRNIKR